MPDAPEKRFIALATINGIEIQDTRNGSYVENAYGDEYRFYLRDHAECFAAALNLGHEALQAEEARKAD